MIKILVKKLYKHSKWKNIMVAVSELGEIRLINDEFIPRIHVHSDTDLDRIMIPLHHLYIILSDMMYQADWEKITIEILERNKIMINFGYIYISVMVNNNNIIQYIAGKGRINYAMLYSYEDPLIDPTWWK